MRTVRLCIVLLVLGSLACLRPGEERSAHDNEAGQEVGAGLSVRIDENLGAIRTLEPGRLEIWAQAPGLRVVLDREVGSESTWEIVVRNGMPDAQLTAVDENGTALAVEVLVGESATRPRWRLDFGEATTAFLIVAPLDVADVEPYRFVVLSDVQRAIDEFHEVIDVLNRTPDIRFVVSTGDLMNQGTAEELRKFQSVIEALEVPWYSTTGNHENGASAAVWADYFGPASFQFGFKGVWFTLVDSSNATLDPDVYVRLDDWLARGKDDLHMFLTHVPPIDPAGERNGSFRNRNEAAKLLARLAARDVDATFYGHIHSYYAFSNGGIPAWISGGGGAIQEELDGIDRHFLVVNADPVLQTIEVAVVRVD